MCYSGVVRERVDHMNEFVIQTDALTKRYGDIVGVDGLSLKAHPPGATV